MDLTNNNFADRIAKVVLGIPKGRVLTYKRVAELTGRPKAYRAVGNFLNSYDPNIWGKLPCHRVIKSDGSLGGYRWGAKKKAEILRLEGFDSSRAKNTPA